MTFGIAAPDRVDHLEHQDRRVGWAEWGERGGAPILFCTGAAMTSSLAFGSDVVRELGVRLVCIDRAGLGRSSPDPEKSFERWADDVAAVLSALHIARPRVIGFSQGAPFALALAARDLASAVAIVSGTDELAHPRMRPLLDPGLTAMIDAIESDPAGFEADLASRADAGGMLSLVIGMSSPHDRRVYEDPAFRAAYRASLAFGFAQGAEGYARDVVLAMARWPMQPEDISVPVRLWYGALDASPVHSPDLGATLAARFPNAALRSLSDEGGSLLWTRSRDILRDVLGELA